MRLTNLISKIFLLAGLLVAMVGCSTAPKAGPTPNDVAEGKKAKSELSSKLSEMPPDQRAEYLKHHPEEVNKVLKGSGIGVGSNHSGPPR